jgi:biopolymer transport protein ExbB/TolQ
MREIADGITYVLIAGAAGLVALAVVAVWFLWSLARSKSAK